MGGSASFAANAQNFSWCAWRFLSPDGKTEVIFDVTGPHFPGLKVEGGNSLTMTLSNIPMELNGWKAVCLFCDAANQWHYTDGTAVITVEAAATATPEPTEAPTATPEPTAAPTATPAPTEAPTEAPAAPVVNTEDISTPEPTPEPEPEKKGSSPILWILIAVVLLPWLPVLYFLCWRKSAGSRKHGRKRKPAVPLPAPVEQPPVPLYPKIAGSVHSAEPPTLASFAATAAIPLTPATTSDTLMM